MNQGPYLSLWIIPVLPLIGGAINGLFGRKLPRVAVSWIAWAGSGVAFAYALFVASKFFALPEAQRLVIETHAPWITVPAVFTVNFGFYLDQLSMVMLLVVTGVGFLIHIYAAGYMAEEGGYYRFFCYLNLFMFFMLILILSSSYLLLFVGWEGVGLASYLLVGFFFLKDSAAQAGKKAFITNRVGDFAFLIGMFMLIKEFGSLDYVKVFSGASSYSVEHHLGTLTIICLLLMFGATGKSAQIPLYVWLPDAMEGPTPVSALIHAATMVTAGIYMMARSNALFQRAPIALTVVAIIGALTAIFAASIGLVQNDIKRVLAYSTVSQLGYMFMACGVAAFSAGIFHLMTHAFFKALLFLSAGAVIHSLGGEQDMRHMGGLRTKIPWTFWVMTVATFAIAGFWPLAGFFSKDEILWQAFNPANPHGHKIFWLIGLITAGMTSFYMFRLWFLTFFGEYRGAVGSAHQEPTGGVHAPTAASSVHGHHSDVQPPTHGAAAHGGHGHGGIHESPWIMLGPLVILALLSFVGGWVGVSPAMGGSNHFEHFLAPVIEANAPKAEAESAPVHGAVAPASEETGLELTMALTSLGVAFAGLGLAWFLYHKRPDLPDKIAAGARGAYQTLLNKYWVDEAYYATIVNPIVDGSREILWRGIDQTVVDGAVNLAGSESKRISDKLRRMQSGNIRSYATWVAVGAAIVVVYMLWMRSN